jgi:hypothetical protein
MRVQAVAEWIGFQVVWLACAFGAARGLNWPGVVSAALFIVLALSLRRWPAGEIAAVTAAGLLGFFAESALSSTGLVVYGAGRGSVFAPAWIVALWCAFAGTLAAIEALIGRDAWIKAAGLGLVTGPLSYLAGARLDALTLPAPLPALIAIALLWAAALPLLLALRARFYR